MKTATKRRHSSLRPKHKHTKEYLKHYYPFLPMLVSIGLLIVVVLNPFRPAKSQVLAASTTITQSGLIDSTNAQRSLNSAGNLTINSELTEAAQAKANDMTARNYWSHKTPEGSDPWIFITNYHYNYLKAGENLAYGFNTSSDVITGWMNSPSHRHNMLDTDFTQVGFGIAQSNNFNSSGPATVVVAMYAKPNIVANAAVQNGQPEVLGEGQQIRNVQMFVPSIWAVYGIGIAIGACITYLLLSNGMAIKRAFAKGERLFLRHPLFDSLIISLVAIGVLLLRASGTIL